MSAGQFEQTRVFLLVSIFKQIIIILLFKHFLILIINAHLHTPNFRNILHPFSVYLHI